MAGVAGAAQAGERGVYTATRHGDAVGCRQVVARVRRAIPARADPAVGADPFGDGLAPALAFGGAALGCG